MLENMVSVKRVNECAIWSRRAYRSTSLTSWAKAKHCSVVIGLLSVQPVVRRILSSSTVQRRSVLVAEQICAAAASYVRPPVGSLTFCRCPVFYAFAGDKFSKAFCSMTLRVCVWPWHKLILKVCEHSILQTACGNFTKFTLRCSWGHSELIRFWAQKVKGEAHDKTKYGQLKYHLFTNWSFRRRHIGYWSTTI